VVEWELEWIAGVFFSSLCSSVWLSAEWRRLWSLSSSMQSSGGDSDTRPPGGVMRSSSGMAMKVKTLGLGVEWWIEWWSGDGMKTLDLGVEWCDWVMVRWWRWRHSTSGRSSGEVKWWCPLLNQGVEWSAEVVKRLLDLGVEWFCMIKSASSN